MEEAPDVLVFPETWNTGFFPSENLSSLCDNDGARVTKQIGSLAKKFHSLPSLVLEMETLLHGAGVGSQLRRAGKSNWTT